MGSGASTESDLSSERSHSARVLKKETPRTCAELKSVLKECMEKDVLAVFEDEEDDEQWSEVCRGMNIVVINTKVVKEDMIRQNADLYRNEEVTEEDIAACRDCLERLQDRIGAKPKLTVEKFQNWGKTVETKVISAYPENKEEMQSLITAASAEGVHVRCGGSRHSWAPLFAVERHLLLNVERMNSDYPKGKKIRLASRDPIHVDMMTGISTGDLKKFQIDNRLNLPCNVFLDVVQMVSVVCTACHGVGLDVKGVGDYVVKMRIFDSSGELRTYTWDDPEMMKAAIASFGAFGVIYDVTMRLIPEKIVETQNRYFGVKELFYDADKMRKLVEENWSVELFWFPYNSISLFGYLPKFDEVWARIVNQVEKPVTLEPSSYYSKKDTKDRLSQKGLRAVAPTIIGDPSLTPFFSWTSFKALKHVLYPRGRLYQKLPHAVHYRKYIELQPVHNMEFAFDFKGDYSQYLKAIQTVVSKVENYENRRAYPLNIALEMRWMAHSELYMHPASIGDPARGGSGRVVYIGIVSLVNTKKWDTFSLEVARDWIALGGVPHLAKQWAFIPGIYDVIYERMGNGIREFQTQLRKSGADPEGLFLNEAVKKLFRL